MKLIGTVGNTPLLEFPLKEGTIWGKAEFLNPGGSVKDRPVAWILELAMKSGKLKKGDTIIEATSGNMGISLAMFSANLGFKCIIVMPSNMSIERKTMLKLFGAELIEVDAGDFDEAINYPEAFVAGTGTGGTIMGAGRYVKEQYPICKLVALEPAESPIMSGGKPGLHGIQGIGDGSKFLVDLNNIDRIEIVSTSEAIEKSKLLAKEWGIFVGFSAAANYLVAERLIKEGSARNVVTILCDRGERYFSCL